ncbi:MAG: hypothetical protein AAF065_07445 [Verrucomicrobiota bacterium]
MSLWFVFISGAFCGLVGAFAMTFFMACVSSAYGKRVDMTLALGSYFIRTTDGAVIVGRLIHAVSGLVFGVAYFAIMHAMGALVFPYAIFLGLGFGFFHGLLMSYMLMFYASERHPIDDYRKATLEEGLLHLVGHLIFGGVTGLLGALVTLIL